jgi:hypothetical protein
MRQSATAVVISAELPHRGWRHLPPGWTERAGRTARQLHRFGLQHARTLDDLATAARGTR